MCIRDRIYLGDNQPGKAVDFANLIINAKHNDFREDIQVYSRILYLMAHYDLDNIDLMPYLVNTVVAFYKKIKTKNNLQTSAIQFFKKISTVGISDRNELLSSFNDQINAIKKDPYEKRALVYLDIVTWIEAKMSKRTISEVIQSKKIGWPIQIDQPITYIYDR